MGITLHSEVLLVSKKKKKNQKKSEGDCEDLFFSTSTTDAASSSSSTASSSLAETSWPNGSACPWLGHGGSNGGEPCDVRSSCQGPGVQRWLPGGGVGSGGERCSPLIVLVPFDTRQDHVSVAL